MRKWSRINSLNPPIRVMLCLSFLVVLTFQLRINFRLHNQISFHFESLVVKRKLDLGDQLMNFINFLDHLSDDGALLLRCLLSLCINWTLTTSIGKHLVLCK